MRTVELVSHLLRKFPPTDADVAEGVLALLDLVKSATEDVLDFAFHRAEVICGEGVALPGDSYWIMKVAFIAVAKPSP